FQFARRRHQTSADIAERVQISRDRQRGGDAKLVGLDHVARPRRVHVEHQHDRRAAPRTRRPPRSRRESAWIASRSQARGSWHKSRLRRTFSRSRPAPIQEYRGKGQLFLTVHCNYDFATTLGSPRMNSTAVIWGHFILEIFSFGYLPIQISSPRVRIYSACLNKRHRPALTLYSPRSSARSRSLPRA